MHRHHGRNRVNKKKRIRHRSLVIPLRLLKTLRVPQPRRHDPPAKIKTLTHPRLPPQGRNSSSRLTRPQSHHLQQPRLLLPTHRQTTHRPILPHTGTGTVTQNRPTQNTGRYAPQLVRGAQPTRSARRRTATLHALHHTAAGLVSEHTTAQSTRIRKRRRSHQ
jgi:hypothetical protein